jgi:hypothetical protein
MRVLNPSQIGLITELKCQTFLIEKGWNVLIPTGNHQKYDLVIEKDNKFYRIQCKHATELDTGFSVSTKYRIRSSTTNQRYTSEHCDYFMTEFKGKFYIFPIFGTASTRFWTVPAKQSGCKMAKDFLAEDVLDKL